MLPHDALGAADSHTIVGVNTRGLGMEVAVVESEDHTSNIDSDVMGRFRAGPLLNASLAAAAFAVWDGFWYNFVRSR